MSALGTIDGFDLEVIRWEDDGGLAPPEGSFEFKPENHPEAAPGVYRTLADHQRREGWQHRDLLVELHRWAGVFEREFALGVPEVALSVDRLRCTRLGQFRYGHNGFGLKGEIIIGRHHLRDEFWKILRTLIHELIHVWQQAHGKPGRGNYHNKQFREKAASYGLVVDHRGVTQYEPGSRFFELLERYGIRPPELPELTATERRIAGQSKLRKWSCGCTNVRVGCKEFSARCLNLHFPRLHDDGLLTRPIAKPQIRQVVRQAGAG